MGTCMRMSSDVIDVIDGGRFSAMHWCLKSLLVLSGISKYFQQKSHHSRKMNKLTAVIQCPNITFYVESNRTFSRAQATLSRQEAPISARPSRARADLHIGCASKVSNLANQFKKFFRSQQATLSYIRGIFQSRETAFVAAVRIAERFPYGNLLRPRIAQMVVGNP